MTWTALRAALRACARLAWLTLFLACSDDTPIDGDDESEEVEVAEVNAALAQGRSVDLGSVSTDGGTFYDPKRWASEEAGDFLGKMCNWNARAVNPTGITTTPNVSGSVTGTCSQDTTTWTTLPREVSMKFVRVDAAAWGHLCAGQFALTLAQAAGEQFIVEENGVWSIRSKPARYVANSSRTVYTVPTPKASNSATWALIAADHLRDAANLYSQAFTTCLVASGQTGLTTTVSQRRGASTAQIPYAEALAANYADALSSVVTAAEVASKFIVAAADAKQGKGDPFKSKVDAWLARYDSRLEGASLYVPVNQGLYTPKLVPIFEMFNATTKAYYYTAKSAPRTGFSRLMVGGKVAPPIGYGLQYQSQSASPRHARVLDTWNNPASTTEFRSFSAPSNWTRVSTDQDRVWVYDLANRSMTLSALELWQTTATGAKKYRWYPAGISPPSATGSGAAGTGWQRVSPTQTMYVVPYASGAPDYPLVTAQPSSDGADRVLELLRLLRVDPREGAIVNGGVRLSTDITEDLRRALAEDYGMFADVTVSTMLDELNVKQSEVEVAARFLVEEQRALARPIIDDAQYNRTGGKSKRVWGTGDATDPTHPAAIYARTAGATISENNHYGDDDVGGFFDGVHNATITAALHYARAVLSDKQGEYELGPLNLSPNATSILKGALEFVQAHLGPRIRIASYRDEAVTTGLNVDRIRVFIQGFGYTAGNIPQAKEEIQVWLGEAGLECALHGSLYGQSCSKVTHAFSSNGQNSSYQADWTFNVDENELVINVDNGHAPPGGALRADVPVFVTRTDRGIIQVLTAFYPDINYPNFETQVMPPMSAWVTEGITKLLAVDPASAADPDFNCVGIKNRVSLEDELMEGQTGADGIESSYSYYLQSARTAADLADRLGEELVENGLQMDIRSENARAELENQCGGVVNLKELSDEACTNNDCDILQTLTNSSNAAYANESLSACLNAEGNVTDVSLGSATMCAFYVTTGGKEGRPCQGTYPKQGGGMASKTCPVLLEGTNKTCASMFDAPAAGATVRFAALDQLGMVPTFELEPVVNEASCADLLRFIGSDNPHETGDFPWKFSYEASELQTIARAIGADYDELGNIELTLKGGPWLGVQRVTDNHSTAPGKFPCEELNATDWGLSQTALHAMCMQAGANRPLFCGLECDNRAEVLEANKRLESAVLALRYVTGAGLDGVQHSIETVDLQSKHIWYKGYDLVPIFSYRAGAVRESYLYPFYTANPGPLSLFTELAALIGEPLSANSPRNRDDQPFEMQAEFDELRYGTAKTIGGVGIEPASFSFKGLLPERAQAKMVCAGQCDPRIKITSHMRNLIEDNDNQFGGTGVSRVIVDWGDLAHGKVSASWDPITAKIWNSGNQNETLANIERHAPPYLNGKMYMIPSVRGLSKRYETQLNKWILYDALTLACMAQHPPEEHIPTCEELKIETESNGGNLDITGLRDYGRVSRALQCKANELLKYASAQVFMDVPKDVAEALKNKSVAQIYPNNQGEMAIAVTDFATSLNGIATNIQSMARIVEQSSRAVSQAENQLRILGYQYDVAVENAAAAVAQQDVNCTIAKINAIPDVSISMGMSMGASFSPTQILKSGLMAGATCSNASVQKAHTKKILELQGDQNLAEEVGVLQALQQNLSQLNSELDETNRAFLSQHAIVQSSVAKIASVRSKAMRAAATALLLDNDDVGHEFNASTSMRARYNTLQSRYEAALDSGKKLAYLARRALEQKVGIDMSRMTEPLPLVQAPASWVNELCSLTGMKYEDIRTNSGDDDESNDENGYAEQYLGGYVSKLENFLKSYSLKYPFSDGDNLSVVSVRDEIVRARVQCDKEGWNELLYTDGAAFGRPDRRDESWDPTCSEEAGRRAWVAPGGAGPFQCYVEPQAGASENYSAVLCNDLGSAKAFALSSVSTDGCVASEQDDEPVPSGPPVQGLAYWISADACTETTPGSGLMSNCTDLSGNGRNLTGAANIVANGIGGRTSISAFGYVNVAKTPTATDRYTVSYVVRTTNSGLLWSATDAQTDGTTRTTALNVGADGIMAFTYQAGTPVVLPASTLSINTGHSPTGLSHVGRIVTIRARGLDGIELFVDGKLRTASPVAAYPMKLGERVAYGGASTQMMFAETIAYQRDLDDDELATMHRYLAERYDIDARGPDGWLDLDDVHRIRTTGSSTVSGLSGSATTLIDRAANRSITPLGSPAGLVTFAGTHRALPFDGTDDSLNWNLLGGSVQRPSATGTPTNLPRTHIDEYAVTLVGQYANLARQHVLYSTGGNLRVVADGTTQSAAIRVVNGATTETYAAPAGLLPADQPFVITLRASRSRNATDLFINGVRQASWPGFEYEVEPRAIGRRGGTADILRGAIAEVQIHARDLTNGSVSALHAQLGEKFGVAVTSLTENGDVAAEGAARLRQWVPVLAGMNYVVSWYQPATDAAMQPTFDLPNGSVVTSAAPTRIPACGNVNAMGCEEETHPDWARHYTNVTVDADGWLGVGFPAPTAQGITRRFAAPQVEMVEAQSVAPAPFFPTDDDRAKPVGLCEDTEGEGFRSLWRTGCEYYCPPGTGNDCAQNTTGHRLAKRCFRELSFSLMLEDIEKGRVFKEAGFAVGNFNYRFDQIAVNIVGNIKNCAESEAPSACYANNHVPYSLHHEGPFRVRNHLGNVYRAPLYPGNIQQSNAMATDRYLTNPLSSADKGMLEDFWDAEFKGRPIDGNYTLRVYESDSMDWEALRDIQIALRYRHWTRAE